jgi:hypothetical protein
VEGEMKNIKTWYDLIWAAILMTMDGGEWEIEETITDNQSEK